MIKIVLLVIFYFTFPVFIIYLCKRWSLLQKLSSIVLAYGIGLLLGTSGILPQGSDGYKLALQGKNSLPKAVAPARKTSGENCSTSLQTIRVYISTR